MARFVRQTILKSLISFIALICFANTVSATTVILPTDDDMIVGARAIVRGKVLFISSALDQQKDSIFTYITVRVQEVLKGQITERRIVLKELGGTVGDRTDLIFGNPRFKVGERVLLYLDTWADGSLRTHQMFLGKFDIIKDKQTGHDMVIRSSPDDQTEILQRQAHGHFNSGVSTEEMELGKYTKMVRRTFNANMERAMSFEAEHYTGVQMQAEPVEYQEVAARGALQPQYALLGPFRFFQPDTGQPVPFTFNPTPPASPVFSLNASDMVSAGAAWSNVSGCSLQMSYAGEMETCYSDSMPPGIHIVYNNCDGRNSPSPGCASILAWGGVRQTGFRSIVIGGTNFRESVVGFVSFNPWASCNFTNGCNVAEIATHEIGHALGLNHSSDTSATMAAFAHFDGRCGSIRTDDQNGIKFIYPGTSGGGSPLTIVTSTLPNGNVGSGYSQALAASGGTPPYTWSLATGPLPGGLSLSSGGVISGTPTATGTFSFTVRLSDTASAPVQKQLSITIGAAGTQYNSDFLSQNIPTTVQAGQTFNATIRWQNNGTNAWDGNTGFRLGSQNPANNTTWGGNAVTLPNFLINAGGTLDLTFTARAPSTPGTYNFQWQCFQEGVGYFGEMSTNVVIQVTGSGGGGGTDNASFVAQSVAASMTAGQSVNVSVTMQNTGTTTWTAGTYKLGSQNPTDNTTWGLNRVNLSSNVAPGAQATFNFTVVAPATAGTYNFQWRMLQDGVGYFGAASTNVAVNVTASGGGGGGAFNAAFVSQSVPATMNPGQTYSVSVTMRNTGTTSWAISSGLSLSSQNPGDNLTWNLNKVTLNKFVGVNSQFTFTFSVRAPSTAGSYNFQWQMKGTSGFFGAKSTNVVVQVGGGGGGGGTNNAAFVSQSVAASMTAGQSVNVSVTMQNTGTTTWTAGTYKLGSQNPTDNTTWGLNRVNLSSNVAPGAQATFNFTVVAPATAGTYNFQWRMLQDGVGYFGAASTNVAVNVTASGGGGGGSNNAAFVSQSVPTSLNTGQSMSVSVTMRNTGTSTWSAGTYKLGSQNPTDSTTWGLSRVLLPSSVAPGGQVTFNFSITAPATAGTYNFQWRMLQDGVGYFGTASTNVAISVTASSNPLVITTASLPNGLKTSVYNAFVNASGGSQPYVWSMTGAPTGFTINTETGLISGLGAAGTYSIQVTVKDANNNSTKKTFKITIK